MTPSRLTTRTLILRNPIQVCPINMKMIMTDDNDVNVNDGEIEGGRGGCEKAGSLQASSPCKTSPSCTNTVMTTVHKDPLLGL